MTSGLRSGEVASAAGVNPETLRYYERRGLLAEPDRSLGGHRLYPSETVTVLRVIKTAQRLGFTLDEVADLLKAGGITTTVSMRAWRSVCSRSWLRSKPRSLIFRPLPTPCAPPRTPAATIWSAAPGTAAARSRSPPSWNGRADDRCCSHPTSSAGGTCGAGRGGVCGVLRGTAAPRRRRRVGCRLGCHGTVAAGNRGAADRLGRGALVVSTATPSPGRLLGWGQLCVRSDVTSWTRRDV